MPARKHHRRFAEMDRDIERRALEEALAEGLRDAQAGRLVPADEAFARVRAALAIRFKTSGVHRR